jgi:ECF transporter S component (folate family)
MVLSLDIVETLLFEREFFIMSKTKKIILSGLMLAVTIVFSRVISIQTEFARLSLEFIPIILIANILGVKYSVAIAVIADLLGATVFSTSGFSYFFGYTINALIVGLIFGIVLYEPLDKPRSNINCLIRLILSMIIVYAIVSVGLTGLWTSITMKRAFVAIFSYSLLAKGILYIALVPVMLGLRIPSRKAMEKLV